MLVLSRKLGEKVQIGNDITVTIVNISGHRVQIGIEAPEDVCILRHELLNRSSSSKATCPHEEDLLQKPDCWNCSEWEPEVLMAQASR
jgi:carbon storage regulator